MITVMEEDVKNKISDNTCYLFVGFVHNKIKNTTQPKCILEINELRDTDRQCSTQEYKAQAAAAAFD